MSTDQRTAGRVLHAALPIRAQVHVTRTGKFDHDAAQAFDRGWTLDQLVTRLTAGQLGDNPGGAITHRLEMCADTDPPRGKPGTVPFCSPECHDNAGWVLDGETGLPLRRCECRYRQESLAGKGESAVK